MPDSEFEIAAQRVVDQLQQYENDLDVALRSGAIAIAGQVEARQIGKLHISVGQAGIDRFVASLEAITTVVGTVSTLNGAIRDTVVGHRIYERLGPKLDVTVEAGGGKVPLPDPGGAPGETRYPLPPPAIASDDAMLH